MASQKFAQVVAEEIDERNVNSVQNAIRLLDEDNTVPFIARYRRVQTGGMDAEKLRDLKRAYDNLKAVNAKAEKIVTKLGESLSKVKREQFLEARTIEEVNELYAPFKKGGKGTLAERARQLGLESPAMGLLHNPMNHISFNLLVRNDHEGLQTIDDVKSGIQHIIADIVSKDEKTNEQVRKMIEGRIILESKTTKSKAETDKENKFQMYYDFSISIDKILSHQTLAINRGEEQKILTVKMNLHERTKNLITGWLNQHWVPRNVPDENRKIIALAVEDSFKRLIEKKLLKRARVKLTTTAEREAAEVFSTNLKRLLLASPVRGKNVLAIDPGFRHGCKIAALDNFGQVLETSVIHPFNSASKHAEKTLVDMAKNIVRILGYFLNVWNFMLYPRCDVIGIGNGTACRETEAWISGMIKKNIFKPLDINYCIVNESGASVYSVTKEAAAELPNLDPNLRSAVSIGRRLQDPLLELVKIEPKHLGVGMYQHDISDILMKASLEGVLEDCVSFVGVDLNASSAAMLKRIAGLGPKKADAIIAWRERNGPFVNRKQLLLVKGLGKKAFEQCAGFVRVTKQSVQDRSHDLEPELVGKKRRAQCETKTPAKKRKTDMQYDFEPLDQTCIHPESYDATYRLLKIIGVPAEIIGSQEIATKLENARKSREKELTETLQIDKETLSLIIKGLQQPLGYDIRSEMQRPSFKKELKSMSDLRAGQTITGIVTNVTSFGAFIDCGVGRDGLIHKSNLAGCTDLGPGDKCECIVLSVDESRGRIGLMFKTRKNALPSLR